MSKKKTAKVDATVIVPTFNSADRIGRTLTAVEAAIKNSKYSAEVIVVNDGSLDNTRDIVAKFPKAKQIVIPNGGPSKARNVGAKAARGEYLIFIDDDCVPTSTWFSSLLDAFQIDPSICGAKGAYKSVQPQFFARFTQLEYEHKYEKLLKKQYIDFVDTYSAIYLKKAFVEAGGFNENFKQASAEDTDLSFRINERGGRLVFIADAIVFHTHPDTARKYFKKRFTFAYWRLVSTSEMPSKVMNDDHTHQTQKLQIVLTGLFSLLVPIEFFLIGTLWLLLIYLLLFCTVCSPFLYFVRGKGLKFCLFSQGVLFIKSSVQAFALAKAVVWLFRKRLFANLT